MFRVLIVDDEKEICGGLVQIPPWHEWGVDRVFAADDGDTALQIVERERPDLIVTDIKMPRLSGIEMVKRLYGELGFPGKVVVISGYDDFSFVKEALKLGVSDYILKPINKSEFAGVVQLALKQIGEDRQRSENQSFLVSSVEKALPKMKEELVRELLEFPFRPSSEARYRDQLKRLRLEWMTESLIAVTAVEIDDWKGVAENIGIISKESLLFAVANVLKEALTEHVRFPHILVPLHEEQWVVVAGANETDRPLLAETLRFLPSKLGGLIEQNVKVRITMGISGFGRWDRLNGLYVQAVQMLKKIKIYGNFTESEEDSGVEDANGSRLFDLSDPAVVVEMMKYGTEQEMADMMGGFAAMVREWQVGHPRDLQHRSFEWLLDVYRHAQKAGLKEDGWVKNPISFWEQLEKFDTLESLQKYLAGLIVSASRSLQESLVPQSQIIQKAEKYIQAHFAENISLVMAADHVHVTPVWLSKLFKKEKGMTFSDYLTDLRLERARLLLQDAGLKIYHICHAVGYQDPVNFTRLFKKKFGFTPKEYRNSRGIAVE